MKKYQVLTKSNFNWIMSIQICNSQVIEEKNMISHTQEPQWDEVPVQSIIMLVVAFISWMCCSAR